MKLRMTTIRQPDELRQFSGSLASLSQTNQSQVAISSRVYINKLLYIFYAKFTLNSYSTVVWVPALQGIVKGKQELKIEVKCIWKFISYMVEMRNKGHLEGLGTGMFFQNILWD